MKILSNGEAACAYGGARGQFEEENKHRVNDLAFMFQTKADEAGIEGHSRAQHEDTLRQVRELLDGIETPGMSPVSELVFRCAIQAMKALLEE